MDDVSRPSREGTDPSNVVAFPPRGAKDSTTTADEIAERIDALHVGVAERLDALQGDVEQVADWIANEAPRQREQLAAVSEAFAAALTTIRDGHEVERRIAERNERELRDGLQRLASRVELLDSPNAVIARAAVQVADGNPAAIDELADAVAGQPSWWARNRGWAIPTLWIAGSALLVGVGVVTYQRMRQIERDTERQRKVLEARYLAAESNYLAMHAAYAEAQRALAAERARPLQSFPKWETHQHDHHHIHEHDERAHHTTAVANAEQVAQAIGAHLPSASAIAREVVVPASVTIVQPTVHTRERVSVRERVVREKVRVVRVPKPESAKRSKRSPMTGKLERGASSACGENRLLAEEVARLRRSSCRDQ